VTAAEPSESIGVILPCFNVAAELPALLAELKQRWPDFRLLAVDDGSRDDTGAAARTGGAELIVHARNRGKGSALATGFQWALAEGLDWVYTMDADGQHLPGEMGSFLEAARHGGWDVVVGTRMADVEGMPWLRRATNRVTSWVVSRLAGVFIPDSQSGFRLFRTACLQGLALTTSHYDAES
jgi:glycosyltransferase involved in cell wall biosynthesis